MPDQIKIIGAAEVEARLRALPPKLQRKVIRPVMRSEAKVVLAVAKKLVPYDAGGHQLSNAEGEKKAKHLRNTLKVRVAKSRKRGEISMRVATGTRAELGIPADEKGYYPFALEYGGLAWQPIPFMRPAYEQTKDKVVNSAREKILAGLEDIMRGFR